MNDNLLNSTDEGEILSTLKGESVSITSWSDTKKSDFVDLFNRRSKVAQYILLTAAHTIVNKAREKYYIGQKLAVELLESMTPDSTLYDRRADRHWNDPVTVGGRSITELGEIAQERAELVINELPPVRKALDIIDPATSKMMARKLEILEAMKVLRNKVEAIACVIDLTDPDVQNLTVKEIRARVKEQERKKEALIHELTDLGKEGVELNNSINKRLFNGIPELSTAIKDVVVQYIDRAKALQATTRRVEERIKFGDSEEALELFRAFERDEASISDTVKTEFLNALERLNLKTKKKALKKGKS